MLPRKMLKNLLAVMAILVLFEQFSGKFCLKFLTLILSALPNMMHLARTFSIKRAKGVRLMTKLLKNCTSSKTFSKMAAGRIHIAYPLSYPPGSTPGHKL